MKLYVKDRFYFLSILPQKAVNYKTYNLKKELIKRLAFTDEDKEKYQIETTTKEGQGESLNWNIETDQANPIEIELTEDLAKYLKDACESIAENEYSDDVWDLIERIFEECATILN